MVVSREYKEGYRRNFTTVDENALTPREHQVLMLVAVGKRNKDIGLALGISICTVKIHLSNIFLKLGVCCRSEAVGRALTQGYLHQGHLRLRCREVPA